MTAELLLDLFGAYRGFRMCCSSHAITSPTPSGKSVLLACGPVVETTEPRRHLLCISSADPASANGIWPRATHLGLRASPVELAKAAAAAERGGQSRRLRAGPRPSRYRA